MLLSKRMYEAWLGLSVIIQFQSLFFWMLLSKLESVAVTAGSTPTSFNPYFSGCFSLSSGRGSSPGQIHCFNPYFSGCFSLREKVLSSPHLDGTFQSLFFWMLLSKHFTAFTGLRESGWVSILIFLDASL